MKRMYTTLALFLASFLPKLVLAQDETMRKMPTGLRADNKIWVVMAVCLTILLGLLFVLIRIDRKLHHLENNHPA